MNRPSVDPAFTFGVSLAISLVLWYPTLRETMRGDIDITDAGIRYFLALAIAWAGRVRRLRVRRDVREPAAPEPTPPPPGPRIEPGAAVATTSLDGARPARRRARDATPRDAAASLTET